MTLYLDGNPQRNFLALLAGQLVRKTASTMLFLFGPIFIYTMLGNNVVLGTVYFLAGSLIYVLVLPTTGLLNIIGFRNALRLSVFAGAAHAFMFAVMTPENVWYTAPLSIFFLALFRYLHWVPYLVDFAQLTDGAERGRQTSLFSALSSIVGIVMPLVGGWLIAAHGLPVLFAVIMFLYVATLMPYSKLPHTGEDFDWSVTETWRRFFETGKTRVMLAHVAFGAERFVGIFLWSIFVFELLQGDYLKVGALSTAVVFVTVIIKLIIGRHIDKHKDREKSRSTMLTAGSVLYAVGWVIKVFVLTAIQIFVVDVYHRIIFSIRQIPFDTINFDIAADEGHYIDEYTVLREMAIHVGRVLMGVLILLLLSFLSFNWIFVVAAIASIAMMIITTKDLKLN